VKVFTIIFIQKFLVNLAWLVIFPLVLFFVLAQLFVPVFYHLENIIYTNEKLNQTIVSQGFHAEVDSKTIDFKGQTYSASKIAGVSLDYRAVVLDEYFRLNNSPLEGLGKEFVEKCNYYNAPFDCTTLPAIAWVETSLCNYPPAHAQRNCWGFGGSGENRIWFNSYEDAIDLITDRLVNAYGSSYMQNPATMQYTYCGAHCHSWGNSVQAERIKISNLSVNMGYPKLIN